MCYLRPAVSALGAPEAQGLSQVPCPDLSWVLKPPADVQCLRALVGHGEAGAVSRGRAWGSAPAQPWAQGSSGHSQPCLASSSLQGLQGASLSTRATSYSYLCVEKYPCGTLPKKMFTELIKWKLLLTF